MSASPQAMLNLIETTSLSDVRSVLGAVQAPALVLRRRGDLLVPTDVGRELADMLPEARYVELPGDDVLYFIGDVEPLADEIQDFLTGTRGAPATDRVLATLLFTDIVGSTERASAMGDAAWRDLMARHDAVTRRQFDRFGAREVKHTGDGFLARLDGPGRAIQCAVATRDALSALDLELRCGVHTGECEVVADDMRGLAVHIAARIAGLAGAQEVLVSGTVKDLVVGSGVTFASRGSERLKGVPGEWPIYAVD